MNTPHPRPDEAPDGVPIGRIIRINLIVVAVVQSILFLLGANLLGEYGGVFAMYWSMFYVGGHCAFLAIIMIVKFLQGETPLGMAYLATMGIVLLIGGGTCFLGLLR